MNLKEIKDAARKAFSDQQSQDTEGGVPDPLNDLVDAVKEGILSDETKRRLEKKRKK